MNVAVEGISFMIISQSNLFSEDSRPTQGRPLLWHDFHFSWKSRFFPWFFRPWKVLENRFGRGNSW